MSLFISSSYHVKLVNNLSFYSRSDDSYIVNESTMYVVFWWHFHWFSQEHDVFEARLSVFCRARNRFSCRDALIRKMMNYLLFEKLKLIMRLIFFELFLSTKKSSQFVVEISREWVWNQNKLDFTICMH